MRRLRQSRWVRNLVRETVIAPGDLIWAVLVHDGKDDPPRAIGQAIPEECWVESASIASAARAAVGQGIGVIALFPHIAASDRDAEGSAALDPDGLIPRAIRAVKDQVSDIGVMCDIALDPYTSHGHDGVLDSSGKVENDRSVALLVEQARVCAEAGADIVAPSDMMDGRVAAIRQAFESAGHSDTIILSYAAKYASGFYGPYRDAVGSAAVLKGDKATYQMDPGNSGEAMREIALDIAEGADMVMVKPGLVCLDIIARAARGFDVPVLAFQVSGECAQIRSAAGAGWIDGDAAVIETLTAFRRAGASAVVTWLAMQAARLLAARPV